MAENAEKQEEIIFYQALEKSPAERETYLQEACRDNQELYNRVSDLLHAYDTDDSFHHIPFMDSQITLESSPNLEGPGSVIGRYKLLEKIGEGGFGAVWAAEQRKPVKRRVALKIIKLGMDTKQVVARFEAERQALALMDHPNIAKVLDAGATETGRPYFVMELVRGIPIIEYCDQAKLSIRDRLDLFIKVCNAIQHAHQKGIIHRDIKPSNILITLHDGVPVPRIIDFGIAKATQQELTELTIYTQHNQFIGTPAYMSPEQAEMSGLDIDTRSDIYSLGVLLYELLTGRTPFDAKELMQSGIDQMRKIIREKEPQKPSIKFATLQIDEQSTTATRHSTDSPKLISLLRGDLDWIVMKCLEKDRARRYETASGLAVDIERLLRNEPVMARPPSAAYRVTKFLRRNKLMAMAGTAVVAALVLGILGSTWQAVRATRAEREQSRLRKEAEKAGEDEAVQRQQAEVARRNAERGEYLSNVILAQHYIDKSQFDSARDILLNESQAAYRSWEWGRLQYQCNLDSLTLRGHSGWISRLAFSPEGTRLASTGGFDATVRVWDLEAGQALFVLRHTNGVHAVAFSPDGEEIATGSAYEEELQFWDARTGQRRGAFAHQHRGRHGTLSAVTYSSNGRHLFTAGGDHVVRLWDRESGQVLRTFVGHGDAVMTMALSRDGKLLVTAGGNPWVYAKALDCTIRIWDVAAARELLRLTGHRQTVFSVALSPDGRWLVSGGGDQTVRLWDVESGHEIRRLSEGSDLIFGVAFSPDGRRVVVGGWDKRVRVFDADTGRELTALRGHGQGVYSVVFSPDGSQIASAGWDGTIKLWEAAPAPDPPILHAHEHAVWSVAFSPDGKRMATGSWDKTAKVWDVADGHLLCRLPVGFPVLGIAFHPTASRLATVCQNGSALIWDVANDSARVAMELVGHSNSVLCVAYSPDGSRIATGSRDGTARMWEANTGRQLLELKAHPDIWSVAFDPAGTRLATAGSDWKARVWDATSGGELLALSGHGAEVLCVAFSPDGRRLATGGGTLDGTIRLWDSRTGELLRVFKGHWDGYQAGVKAIAFSPDGQRLATAGGGTEVLEPKNRDHSAKIWDIESGRELLSLEGHSNVVYSVAFSPDGRQLATTSMGTVILWGAFPWKPEDYPGGKELTFAERLERYKRQYWTNHKSTSVPSIRPAAARGESR